MGDPVINAISELLYNKNGILAKPRMEIRKNLDVHLDEFVPLQGLFATRLFGTVVHVLWDQWEYQYYEVYKGDPRKKFGTAGTIDRSRTSCRQPGHNACLDVEESDDYLMGQGMSDWCSGFNGPGALCGRTFEFRDHFAHSMSPRCH